MVEEVLRKVVKDMFSYMDLGAFLDKIAKKNQTTKHWVENLINPIFIALLFLSAERE